MELNVKKPDRSESPLLLIAPFFLWGTAMVAMKGALPQTTPLFVATVRLLPAGLLVLAVAAIQGRPQPKSWIAWLWISLFALVDAAMFQGFLVQGLVRTGAGLGSVIIDSQPLAVALLSSWLFGEIIGVWGWLGLAIGIVGISLISLPAGLIASLLEVDIASFSWSWQAIGNSGEFWMLLAALSMAGGTVMIRFVCRHVDPVVATGWHMAIGGIPLLLLCAISETGQLGLDLPGWMALGYAAVFGSAIAYGLFFYLASQGNLTSLSSLTFLTPVFALAFGNLFLAETLNSLQWLGVSLTLVSIYLINQREKLLKQLVTFWTEKTTSARKIPAQPPAKEL